jgi:hypothetical protein
MLKALFTKALRHKNFNSLCSDQYLLILYRLKLCICRRSIILLTVRAEENRTVEWYVEVTSRPLYTPKWDGQSVRTGRNTRRVEGIFRSVVNLTMPAITMQEYGPVI